MYIYSLKCKGQESDIYIGKTKNVKSRCYSHKNASKNINRNLYCWIRSNGGWDNVIVETLKECGKEDVDYWEQYYINFYEESGYTLHNLQLTKDYAPTDNFYEPLCKDERDSIWETYVNTDLSFYEIAKNFNVSSSLVTKIIQENGGSPRKGKLNKYYKKIQQKIMQGIPIRQIAKKYGVCKNAISNINRGKTAYDKSLSYPLNEKVRDKILKENQFKSKV